MSIYAYIVILIFFRSANIMLKRKFEFWNIYWPRRKAVRKLNLNTDFYCSEKSQRLQIVSKNIEFNINNGIIKSAEKLLENRFGNQK